MYFYNANGFHKKDLVGFKSRIFERIFIRETGDLRRKKYNFGTNCSESPHYTILGSILHITFCISGSQAGAVLPPWGHLTSVWRCFWPSQGGGSVVLLNRGQRDVVVVKRPEMLLNVLQCTGQSHNKKLSGPKCQLC